MKKIIIYFLLFFIFTSKIKSHSVQIAYCVDCSGNLRIFVEHWHSTQDPNSTNMTIQLNVNSVITTQTNTPAFGITNVPFGSLPGCATPITSVAGCPGYQNTYNDWLIYDYTGLPAGVPISFTILSGNNSFTSDGCGMYPLTVNFTTPSSTVVNGSSITVCQGQSIAAITVPSGINWSNSNPSIGLAASGVGPITSFIATNFGNATISYFTSCFQSTLVAVTVNPLPVVTIINSSPVCIGSSLTLNSSATNSYTWVGASGFTSNLQNPSIINTAILNAGIYSLTVSTQKSQPL